jgi:hypothetical protein
MYAVRGSNAEAHVAKALSAQDRATSVFVASAEYCVLTEWMPLGVKTIGLL